MKDPIKKLVQDYTWVHLSLGLLGNITFFAGSILFLPWMEEYKVIGTWLFIGGSFLMLIGSLGRLLLDLWKGDT